MTLEPIIGGTLQDMCTRLPLTREEMLEVNGMSEKKVKQYGEQFLKRIREASD